MPPCVVMACSNIPIAKRAFSEAPDFASCSGSTAHRSSMPWARFHKVFFPDIRGASAPTPLLGRRCTDVDHRNVHFGADLIGFHHGGGNGGIGLCKGHVVHGNYSSTAGLIYMYCHHSSHLVGTVKCRGRWPRSKRSNCNENAPSSEFGPGAFCLRQRVG